MNRLQWTMLTLSGIIFVVGYNFGLVIRDYKHIQEPQIEKPIYQSIPVIPFSN